MQTNVLERAIRFAVDAHAGQLRKDHTPFILHPLEDASIVGTMTKDPEILAAAVLHDTVEDTAVTPGDILASFGQRVHDLVMSETEEKRPELPPAETWRIRKEESLLALSKNEDPAVKMLWLGDKLSNLRALRRAYDQSGEAAFQKFNTRDPFAHKWYYGTILELLESLKDTAAYQEYSTHFHRVFDAY